MRARRLLLPIAVLALVGCDRITGGVDQKSLDAEAIGYSCRISLKPPEDCIKENDTHSPTSILFGWKEADRDIREKAIDPNMGRPVSHPQPSVPPAAATEGKPVAEKAAAVAKSEKPAASESEKPAAAAGKPDKGATEKPAGR